MESLSDIWPQWEMEEGVIDLLNLEDEIAFTIWSTQTGNGSRTWWNTRTTEAERDQYERAAKMVVQRLGQLGALHV